MKWSEQLLFREKVHQQYPDLWSLKIVRKRLLFEVIEHLNREKGRGLARKICELLKSGGRVILTTPNVYTPGQYWKDVSHETPYHYEELGGLFLSEGFEW